MSQRQELERDLERIESALEQAGHLLQQHAAGTIDYEVKPGHGPVTEADRQADRLLQELLLREGDGWLSEETPDDRPRHGMRRVWMVDPIDGTRSFVAGRPEYSVSIALLLDGRPVLGGVHNPAAGVMVTGGVELGVRVRGDPRLPFGRPGQDAALRVLGSRSEIKGGLWQRWQDDPDLLVLPISSVAYKLALVAAGSADATWTLWPKHEWDVAAGAALVCAAGGSICLPHGMTPRWNQRRPKFDGFVAAAAGRGDTVRRQLRF